MSCSSPIKDKYFHEESSQVNCCHLHRSHLIVRIPISQICRTSVSFWDLLYSWWNANCLSTDASNVEDINIPHLTECLSLSCVASFEDWYCLFRTCSFTLRKNDLDSNDISDSASVSESHIIVFNNESVRVLCELNRSPCSNFHQFIRFPLLRRTNSYQHSILSSLMSKRLQQVALFFWCCSVRELRGN